MNRWDVIAAGVTVLAVVVLPGLANAALSSAGYETLGTAVWAAGYGCGAVFLWYVWVRPLDITGPVGTGTDDRSPGETEAAGVDDE